MTSPRHTRKAFIIVSAIFLISPWFSWGKRFSMSMISVTRRWEIPTHSPYIIFSWRKLDINIGWTDKILLRLGYLRLKNRINQGTQLKERQYFLPAIHSGCNEERLSDAEYVSIFARLVWPREKNSEIPRINQRRISRTTNNANVSTIGNLLFHGHDTKSTIWIIWIRHRDNIKRLIKGEEKNWRGKSPVPNSQ